MTCPNCGAYGRGDESTGYNADELCPDCKAAGFDVDNAGNILEPVPALASKLASICNTCGDVMMGATCGTCEANASGSDQGVDECPF